MTKPGNGWHRRPTTRTTTERGYGTAHQKERKRRVPLYTPHTPCFAGCGRPLGPDRTQWHLPHSPDRTAYLPGLWCADCNRRDGARRGNQRRNNQRRDWYHPA